MEYLYIGRKNDRETIIDYKEKLELKTVEELVEAYNKQAKIGIVGAHQQALYLVALRFEFLERFSESPIYVTDKVILGMVGEVKLENGQIQILK